ncbi:MAG: T9SS type A sorting domain-containing protein [Candidatus Cloacimonetes bacterium]|nr:T9SS type A sorting domain-containing protein [Candidatus Cloacimonadota bacterium]
MKRIALVFISLLFVISIFADGVLPLGSGTETDPYQIATLDNLLWVSTNESSWHSDFIQMADIDASDTENWNGGEGFSPIGNDANRFYGNYDGQGYSITSLYINRPTMDNQGLFGITQGATISNITVSDVSVTGYDNVGSIVGYNRSELISIHSSGEVNGHDFVGGLVGRTFSIYTAISNSSAACVVSGNKKIGGICGHVWGTDIINTFYDYETVLINDGHIISVGALDSEMYEDWISNNMSFTITDYLTFNGTDYLISSFSDFKTLLAFGQMDLSFSLDAMIDLSDYPGFYIPYFKGSFNGNFNSISNLNVTQEDTFCLGLFNYTYYANISNLPVHNVVLNGYEFVGGLSGITVMSNIVNCSSSGIISGSSCLGGLIGGSGSLVSCSCSTATINGSFDSVGGLIGYMGDAVTRNCYSDGVVSGQNKVGGLVGYVDYGEIQNSFSGTSVSGTGTDVGGLVGMYVSNEALLESSFWNIESSGQATSAGGTGLTPLQFRTYEIFADAGWDLVDETANGTEDWWYFDPYYGSPYPFLFWEPWPIANDEQTIPEQPGIATLIGNYPNPFNPETTIKFSISSNSNVDLSIYNIKGQRVRTLANQQYTVGEHSIVWNGDDDSGKSVGSGVYFYKLGVDGRTNLTKKCILIK